VVGKAYYYDMEGDLDRIEKVRGRKIKTTTYYAGPGKKKKSKGIARLVISPEKVHYYYEGWWDQFDTSGKKVSRSYYEKGVLIRTERLVAMRFNDSLSKYLLSLDEDFRNKNKQMLDSVQYSWSNPKLAEKYRIRMYAEDSLSFLRAESVLREFGYPEKEWCGESAAGVPFYIISHAPVSLRSRYVEYFKAAAGTGKLDRTAFAFYLDKVKIVNGEKQVYGTQFYTDKNWKRYYYPIEDPSNLNKRRAEMGMEPIDTGE
jgi:hypothetical protein